MVDREGNVWIGTMNEGVYRYSGDKITIIDKQTGLSNNMIISITEDLSGDRWIATQDGLNRFDGDNYKIYTTKEGLPINQVDVVFTDSRGYVWLGFFGGGLIQIDPNATLVQTEDRTDTISSVILGANVYLTKRVILKLEFNQYKVLTSRNDNEEITEWKAGLSAFF